jgi:hypothetical protein
MDSGGPTQEKLCFSRVATSVKKVDLLGASRANTDRCEVEASKMSTEPTKPESEHSVSEDEEVEIISEGTFGGTRKNPVEVEKGERVPDDTGDQGGGQN